MRNFRHGQSCDSSCCLRIQNLSVKIGTDDILSDVNLHIHCGQMVALIGPNGAGKSTLVKAILGQREYEGVIAFSAPGIRHRRPPRIGYVPQSPSFDAGDPVSVQDLFACCLSRRPAFLGLSADMREKTRECLERVHGEALIDKRIGTLSGGELQRVLLALALEPLPNILILDEPLSGVDVEGQTELMDMLDEIRKRYDLSILMITHDFGMLPTYADNVVLIDHAIVKMGTPDEVLDSEEFRRVFHRRGGVL
jgi:zinc transport system ATP-binding protein